MERALFIVWGIWLLLIFVSASRVFAYLIARRRQDKRWVIEEGEQKNAVVIVPVKGFDLQSTPTFFDTLFAQEYRSYRVIVTFESWEDPVAEWLSDELEISEENPVWTHPDKDSALREIVATSGGLAESEGQKVCNQRAAFEHLSTEDEIVVFADADISMGSDWLGRLTAPINCGTHPLATTYRWLVPKRPTFPNQLASVINGSITTQGGWEFSNVLWGGSMALTRSVFDDLDVPSLLEGSLNDDLRISKAARKAKNRIGFVRSLVLPTMIDFNWGSFLEFAKRQYTQVKFFSPILYFWTNILLAIYAIGFFSVVAALIYGIFYAWIPLAAAYIIDQFRGLARQQVYLSLFPQNGIRQKLFATCWLEQMLTPFWMVLHWLIVVSTWTQNRIVWGGIRYQILSISKTKILDRTPVTQPLPVGVPGLALMAALHDRQRGTLTSPIHPVETTASPATEPVAPVTVTATEEVPVEVTEVGETVDASEGSQGSESSESVEPTVEKTVPAEPAPRLAHPGVSTWVTPLARQPVRFHEAGRAVEKSSHSPLVRHGRVIRGIEAHTRLQPGRRFPVRKTGADVTASPSSEPRSTRSLSGTAPTPHRVVRALPAPAARIAAHAAPSARLSGLDRQRLPAEPPIHGMSRLDIALSKTAEIPRVHFRTRPSLAFSSRPSGAAFSPSPRESGSYSASVDAAEQPRSRSTSSLSSRTSFAAHRPSRKGRGDSGFAPGSTRVASSGRTNLTSRARRGSGRSRPTSRGASGRTV